MDNFSNFICLDESSKVMTNTNVISIKDVIPGMTVFSFDEESKEIILDEVVSTVRSRHSICATLLFENEVMLRCTIDHPVFVESKGWCAVSLDGFKDMYNVNVKKLEVGDVCPIMQENKVVSSRIKSIALDPCSDYFYCLSTKKYHNFFANGVIAHDVSIERFPEDLLIKEGVEVKSL